MELHSVCLELSLLPRFVEAEAEAFSDTAEAFCLLVCDTALLLGSFLFVVTLLDCAPVRDLEEAGADSSEDFDFPLVL